MPALPLVFETLCLCGMVKCWISRLRSRLGFMFRCQYNIQLINLTQYFVLQFLAQNKLSTKADLVGKKIKGILKFLVRGFIVFFSKILLEISRRIVIMNSNNLRMNGQHFHPISPSFSQQHRPQQQLILGNPVGPTYTNFHNVIRIDRPMYSSTIQPTTTQGLFHSQSQGFGALEKMGRFIKEEPEAKENMIKAMPVQGAGQTKPLTFRMDKDPKVKMAASSIFTSNTTKNSMVFSSNENNVGLSKLNALMANKKIVEVQEEEVDQPLQERRKREILSFRSEGDILNKKIQNTFGGLSKNGQAKPYFQLSTRKNQRPAPNQGIIQASSIATNQIGVLAVKENTKPFVYLVQGPSTGSTSFITKQQQASTLEAPKQGMFKKKTPYQGRDPSSLENRPLATVISLKSQKTIKKICKSDFLIGKKMGKGQFGEVMMVIHKETGFLCAMKVMSKKQIREEKYVNQVARELSIQFYLNHRYIAPLYGYFQDEDNVYLLVQFCADGQLLQKMRKSHRLEDPQTSPIIRQVCQGLDYIHKEQIIHRDIKPENILFQFGTAKISDFGWAVYSGNEMRRTVSGTPLYYCPELVTQTAYDEKIDIWSIGMMTYECLIGKIPFKIYSEFDLNRIVTDEITFPEYVDVTDQAKDFILSSMRKNPQERMEIREMLRHPFIAKYMRNRGADEECLKEMRRILNE